MAKRGFLSRAEVATLLGVSPSTVTRWARQGRLPAVETLGGHRRYPREAVLRLREHLQRGSYVVATAPLLRALAPSELSPDDTALVEVRMHGRAGQGLITAGELLAEAALRDGKYFQAFPEFGAERTGAPMEAFFRLSDGPINTHAPVQEPDVVLVIDPTLLGQVPVFRGVPRGALAVVNHRRPPAELVAEGIVPKGLRVVTVDATAIAMELVGRPVPNIPVLGALLRVRPLVTPELMARVIRERMEGHISRSVAEANVAAFWRGWREARHQGATRRPGTPARGRTVREETT